MAVQRWIFDDGKGETWTVPRNPASMTSATRQRNIEVQGTTAVTGRDLLWERRSSPKPWEFAGKLHTQAHYDGLHRWVYDKVQRFWIYDHFGRRLEVVLNDLDAVHKTKMNVPWYHEYTAKGILLDVKPAP